MKLANIITMQNAYKYIYTHMCVCVCVYYIYEMETRVRKVPDLIRLVVMTNRLNFWYININ